MYGFELAEHLESGTAGVLDLKEGTLYRRSTDWKRTAWSSHSGRPAPAARSAVTTSSLCLAEALSNNDGLNGQNSRRQSMERLGI